jgi:restriction system protein
MSVNQKRRARNNVIIFTVIVIYLILVNLGFSSSYVFNLIAIALIFWGFVYIIYNPIMSILNDILQFIKERRMKNAIRSTRNINELSWSEFEYYVAERLKSKGYTDVQLTEKYDLGVDIIAKKDGLTWGVQVKHYSNLVGVDAVRQVVTALNKYKCNRAMVVTNSEFTKNAIELAKSNGCVLIDTYQIYK